MSLMIVPFLVCGYHAPSLSPHRFHFLEISRMAGALLDQPFIPAPVQVWWLHSECKKRRKGVEQEDYRLEGHAVQCQASWKASHDFDKLAAASRVCTHLIPDTTQWVRPTQSTPAGLRLCGFQRVLEQVGRLAALPHRRPLPDPVSQPNSNAIAPGRFSPGSRMAITAAAGKGGKEEESGYALAWMTMRPSSSA